jgi:hypothetical protein
MGADLTDMERVVFAPTGYLWLAEQAIGERHGTVVPGARRIHRGGVPATAALRFACSDMRPLLLPPQDDASNAPRVVRVSGVEGYQNPTHEGRPR